MNSISIANLHHPIEADPFESYTYPHFRAKLKHLTPTSSLVALGLKKNELPVGLILAETRLVSDESASPSAWIHSLYICPSHRRQGFGRALLGAMEAELQLRGCSKMRLNYLASLSTRSLEQLLAQTNWDTKNTGVICYASKSKVLNAPSPHLID